MRRTDEIDMKILSELVKDASISVPKLSKKISLNISIAYGRIKRLVKRGYIKRFTVEVDEGLLGYTVSALIGVNIDSRFREKIIPMTLRLDGVKTISEITGRFDLLIHTRAKSLGDLHNLLTNEVGRLEGVLHTETFIEMKRNERELTFVLA